MRLHADLGKHCGREDQPGAQDPRDRCQPDPEGACLFVPQQARTDGQQERGHAQECHRVDQQQIPDAMVPPVPPVQQQADQTGDHRGGCLQRDACTGIPIASAQCGPKQHDGRGRAPDRDGQQRSAPRSNFTLHSHGHSTDALVRSYGLGGLIAKSA
jgi:hypothetical protein